MTTTARMAGGFALSISTVLLSFFLTGCSGEKKIEPVKVGELETYKDPAYGYTIQFPKGWIPNAQVGRASFYNAQEVDKKFLDPTGPFPDGVVIGVDIIPSKTTDQEKKRIVDEMTKNGFVLAKEEPVTVAGKQGARISYSGQWTQSVKEIGQHIYVPLDTLLYDIRFAGFGGYYEAYKAVFDASLGSFQFPKPVVPGRDATLPSETMTDYAGKLFSFQYPDNYNFVTVPKGSNEEVVELRGTRQDCSIRFDVFGAKGLTVEKVFDQNKGKIKAPAINGRASVAGLTALTQTYTAGASVERRFYFIVKNDKVFRITMDWYRPQREEYLAAYDKVLVSLKIK